MMSTLALKVDINILFNWRTAVLPELRKVVTFDEDIYVEGGRASNPPLRMIGVAAVVKNPWFGRGFVEDLAPDIKRMYLHEPPKPEHFAPRTPRERRQAWKEGRLGNNPNPIRPKEQVKKGVHPNASKKRSKKKRT